MSNLLFISYNNNFPVNDAHVPIDQCRSYIFKTQCPCNEVFIFNKKSNKTFIQGRREKYRAREIEYWDMLSYLRGTIFVLLNFFFLIFYSKNFFLIFFVAVLFRKCFELYLKRFLVKNFFLVFFLKVLLLKKKKLLIFLSGFLV